MRMNEEDLLKEEFHEAWEHYRHLENARATYMQFFYTVTFAVIGFLFTLQEHFKQLSFFSLTSTFFTLSIFGTYIYLNISKIKFVLEHYLNVIDSVRKIVYTNYEARSVLFDIRKAQHKTPQSFLSSIQKTTELILIIAILVFNVSIAILIASIGVCSFGGFFSLILLITLSLGQLTLISRYHSFGKTKWLNSK